MGSICLCLFTKLLPWTTKAPPVKHFLLSNKFICKDQSIIFTQKTSEAFPNKIRIFLFFDLTQTYPLGNSNFNHIKKHNIFIGLTHD